MKLSVRGEYALRALIALAKSYDQGIVRIQVISLEQDIPKRFLEQILNDLRSGGFVESRRGAAGGYRLARAPEEITLAAIIRYIQGAMPLTPIGDAPRTTGKNRDGTAAAIRSVIKEVRQAMHAVLEKITLADLCERARKLTNEVTGGFDYVI